MTRSLQVGDGGASKVLGWLLGGVMEVLEIASRGWSFPSAVPGLMSHHVVILTPDSTRSCVMQGASYTQRKVFMVPFVLSIPFVFSRGGSISPDSFLPSIQLLVVIVVTVVIVAVIMVVVVVAVIVAIIGLVVVVVGSVLSIIKLSFMIIDVDAVDVDLLLGAIL
nr:hypothetical protein [Tanacetum cinerariifolium]